MSSPICHAPYCDQPSHGSFLCGSCTRTLGRDLDSVPILLEDLEVTICRQDKISEASGRSTDERPLPLRLGPVEARRDLAETLRVWSSHMRAHARGGHALAVTVALSSAAYLRANLDAIAIDRDAGQIADEIGYAVLMSQRAVDKPLQHVYVGPCVCGADLYAHPRAADVTCKNTPCEREYPVKERREWLLEQISDQLLTATEISRAIPNLLQQQITASMIRGLAHRGKLTAHPPLPDRPREPVYRIGDAVALLTELVA